MEKTSLQAAREALVVNEKSAALYSSTMALLHTPAEISINEDLEHLVDLEDIQNHVKADFAAEAEAAAKIIEAREIAEHKRLEKLKEERKAKMQHVQGLRQARRLRAAKHRETRFKLQRSLCRVIDDEEAQEDANLRGELHRVIEDAVEKVLREHQERRRNTNRQPRTHTALREVHERQLSSRVSSPDPELVQQDMKFSQVHENKGLGPYVVGSARYETLSEAKEAARTNPEAVGITQEPETSLPYTLRCGTTFVRSDTGERSWLLRVANDGRTRFHFISL